MSASKKNLIFILLVFVVVTAYTLFGGGGKDFDFSLENETLTVGGPEEYSFSVPFADIADVALAEDFDPGLCVSGGSSRKYNWGTWENAAFGEYQLCMLAKLSDCVVVTAADGAHYVFNIESDRTTAEFASSFREYLDTPAAEKE